MDETTGKPAAPKSPKKRTIKPLGHDGEALVTEAKNQLKEARKLGKILDTVKELGAWGLDKVEAAVKAKRETLTT